LYVKLNTNLINSGQAVITVPPVKLEMPYTALESADFDISSATLDLGFSDGAYDATNVIISATPAVGNGVSFVKNKFRVLTGISSVTAAAALYAAYASKFGTPVIGTKIFIGVEPVLETGQKGVRQTVQAIVIA
jgi:hypothetical protein